MRRLLTFSTSLSREKSHPAFSAILTKACTSFGKQKPPNPIPGFKKVGPILGSIPIPSATFDTSAPTASHKSDTMLMKEIFMARKEFDACLISSAELLSVTNHAGFLSSLQSEWTGQW